MKTCEQHPSPVRVLHVIESLGTGGMENGVVNLVNNHRSEQVIADVLCLRTSGEFATRIPATQLHYDASVGSSIRRSIGLVTRTCRKTSYDIVHSHSWAALVPAFVGSAIADPARKLVHGEHGTLYLDTWKRRRIQKLLFNRTDGCLSVSASLSKEIETTLSLEAGTFQVIGNGVDVERFATRESARRLLCRTLEIPGEIFVIGSVGRLAAVKDYPTLLHAYARLRHTARSESHLVLIGDGPERDALQSIARDLSLQPQVTFLGRRDDVADLLSGLDVFVLPSLHEGMSNTLIEAAASGVPAVASDIDANREVVRNGETGFLFATGNSKDLWQILKTLMDDRALRENISDNASSLARQKYSLPTMVRNYERFYLGLYGA